MQTMARQFRPIYESFIDIVYKIFVFFSIYFVVKYWESEVVKVSPDLVEAAGFGGSLHQADLPVFRAGAGLS